MRLAVVLLLSAWMFLAVAPRARALTLCPITEFTITFDPDSAELDAGDQEMIQAGVERAHACGGVLDAVELVVAGDVETEGSLDARRFSAVRTDLVQNGIDPGRIHAAGAIGESYGSQFTPIPNAVIVLIDFNYSGSR
jgi:outer membrane protein OmpA-like peptidoglycan-associated protein